MVGDADAVEAALAVEINHLRHREFAVGIIGVDVEIAQEHLREVFNCLKYLCKLRCACSHVQQAQKENQAG